MANLTYAQVAAVLKYDPETGKLWWLERPAELFKCARHAAAWNGKWAGREAFTAKVSKGYLSGFIFGKSYRAHRVAWLLFHGFWPVDQIDHLDGNPQNNRIKNLRAVTERENSKNRRMSSANSSGVSGVNWDRITQKWHARIGVDGASIHLGFFSDKTEASAARRDAEAKYGFSVRHGTSQ